MNKCFDCALCVPRTTDENEETYFGLAEQQGNLLNTGNDEKNKIDPLEILRGMARILASFSIERRKRMCPGHKGEIVTRISPCVNPKHFTSNN